MTAYSQGRFTLYIYAYLTLQKSFNPSADPSFSMILRGKQAEGFVFQTLQEGSAAQAVTQRPCCSGPSRSMTYKSGLWRNNPPSCHAWPSLRSSCPRPYRGWPCKNRDSGFLRITAELIPANCSTNDRENRQKSCLLSFR